MEAAAFEQVYGAFQHSHAYFGPLFGCREARDHSRHYLQTLLVQARRRPVGRQPPLLGRQRTPLLPVQRSGGYPVGDPGIRGRLPVAY